MRKCPVCGIEITGRKASAVYCSPQCQAKAKNDRYQNRLRGVSSPQTYQAVPYQQPVRENPLQGLMEAKEQSFEMIRELENKYKDKIQDLQLEIIKKDNKIERQAEKLAEQKEKHEAEVKELSSNKTKETIQAVASTPIAQGLMGMFADKLTGTDKNSPLGGVDNEFTGAEKGLIYQFRELQPDIKTGLNMALTFLFDKKPDEQRQLLQMLQAFLQGDTGGEDDE